MTKLTRKQELFIQGYLVSLNATKAAIDAGYSKKRASEIGYQLLQKTTIKEAIEKAMEERAIEVKRTAQDVFRDIIKVTEDAASEKNYSAALKGLELQGRHLSMFDSKLNNEPQKIDVIVRNFRVEN